MAKIDKIKEILNTLRITMSIAFGLLVLLVGNIVKRYDLEKIDTLFWTGVGFSFIIILFITLIIRKIAKKTKEIGEL